jgi:hypothetical protein
MCAATPFPHGRTSRHVVLVRTQHRGHPRPQRRVLLTAGRRANRLPSSRASPRDARRAKRSARVVSCALWTASVPWRPCAGNGSAWAETMHTPAPGVSSTLVNRCGRASAGSVLDANSWRPAQSAAPRHPVSRPSSRCDLVMFVELWEGLCWSAPQRRGQTRTVDPPPVRALGDAAPCVYSRRPSRRAVNFTCTCSHAPLRPGRAHPSAVARLPPETTSPVEPCRRATAACPRERPASRRPGDFRSNWGADGP